MSHLSVRSAALEAPDQPALIFGEQTWTWAAVANEVEAELARLADQMGGHAGGPPRIAFEATPEPGTVFFIRHGLTDGERQRQLDIVQSEAMPLDPSLGSDLLAILFTSGTSGLPRAIGLSCDAFTAAAAGSAARLGTDGDDRWLCCLPLGHVGGLSILIRSLIARSTMVLLPRFEPALVTEAIDKHAVTLVSLVPAMLTKILAALPDWRPPPALRTVLLGGAPITETAWREGLERGIPLRLTYGLTETCSQVATALASSPSDLVPLDGILVRVSEGHIEVAGPTLGVQLGESANRTPDGYLRTGDLGRMRDDGVLEVLGRADEMIITGGENVSPIEVEGVLESHPKIARAAVFGHPDEEWGEIVAAALVVHEDRPESADIATWCASRLASFKRPRRVAFLDELPTNQGGKLDRRAVARLTAGRLWPIS